MQHLMPVSISMEKAELWWLKTATPPAEMNESASVCTAGYGPALKRQWPGDKTHSSPATWAAVTETEGL